MDAHEHRHRHILAPGAFIENVDGPRLRRIALDHAIGFEAGKVAVHRRARLESDSLADFPHRRWVAFLQQESLDELKNLLLAIT